MKTFDVAMRLLQLCNESYNKKLTFVTSQTLSQISLFKTRGYLLESFLKPKDLKRSFELTKIVFQDYEAAKFRSNGGKSL